MKGLILVPIICLITIVSVVLISKVGGNFAMKNIRKMHSIDDDK